MHEPPTVTVTETSLIGDERMSNCDFLFDSLLHFHRCERPFSATSYKLEILFPELLLVLVLVPVPVRL